MDLPGLALVAFGVLAFGFFSRRLERAVLTPAMVFTLFGLVVGPAVLGWVDLDVGHGFLHWLAEATLILVLFTDAARIDVTRLRGDHDLPVRLLIVGLPLAVIFGAVAALGLPLGLPLWEAALLSAILAPTDAALGQAVVTNPAVPVRIRQCLNVESGLNDGLALPLVLLFGALASGAGAGAGSWLSFALLQLSLGPLVGTLLGWAGGACLDRGIRRGLMAASFQGPAVLALAFISFAAAEIVGGNGFIAAFVAGLAFGRRVRGRCGFVIEFAESEGQLLVLLTFLIFGAAILPEAGPRIDVAIVVYAILSLTFVRGLAVALSLFGSGVRAPTVGFLAWFGPRGLASVLFALLVLERFSSSIDAPTIGAVVTTTVVVSIFAHGVTAGPGARWYGALARRGARFEPGSEELKPVLEMPTRLGMIDAYPSDPEDAWN